MAEFVTKRKNPADLINRRAFNVANMRQRAKRLITELEYWRAEIETALAKTRKLIPDEGINHDL